MNPTEKLELQVEESQDGSAVVELPEGEAPVNEPEELAEGGEVQKKVASDEDDDESDDDAGISAHATDDEREAIRAARREERKLKKQIQREKARESNHLINALRKQNNELAERLAVIEKKTSGAEYARLEKTIEDQNVRVLYARQKMAEANSSGDGEAFVEAQEAWYEARRQLEALQNFKERAVKSQAQTPKQNATVVDPLLQRKAAGWMAKNGWYDVHGKTEDSRIAKMVDERLAEEGWDASTDEYWDELDNRLQKYLPHRYTQATDEKPSLRNRPRNVITSSGKESVSSAKGNQFVLSPDRVRALKEAGMWEDADKRAKAIRKYAEYDRSNNARSN